MKKKKELNYNLYLCRHAVLVARGTKQKWDPVVIILPLQVPNF
jgi:hypothetical protein